jgi:hypothetical protein
MTERVTLHGRAEKAGDRIRRFVRRLRFGLARRRYERASATLAASGGVDEEMLANDEAVIVYPDTIPRICCGRSLKDWSAGNNQPIHGLEFAAAGHYPSSIHDNGNGELVVNICDPCLLAGAQAGRVLKRTHPEPRHRGQRPVFEQWRGP